MKTLITGGSGFIGCNLAEFFASNGDEVIVIDNLSRKGSEKNLEWLKEKKGITFVKADVRKFDEIKKHFKDVDRIFHTAAQVAVTTSVRNPREDYEINSMGALNVLEAARLNNMDPVLIYTSTNKVYGNNVNEISLTEREKRYEFSDPNYKFGVPETFSADANEHTPYGSSKYAADIYVRDYGAVFGMKTVTFRMSCIYGVRQFGNEDQGWIAHFIIQSLFNKPLTIYGDGKQVRDVLFISDLVNAFNLASQNINKTKGQVYNMGGGPNNTLSLLELIEILENMMKKKIKFSFDKWRPFDQKVYISDIRKAKKDFGWEPRITREEGIKRLYDWINQNMNIFSI